MQEFFDICAEIESTMCLIYRRMAHAMRGNEKLQELMLQLAKDEADHANQVRYARVLPQSESFAGVKIGKSRLELLLLKAQSLLRDLENDPLTEEQALLKAIELEEEFIGVHIGTAVEFKDEKLKERFRMLARDDEKHVGTLRNYFNEVYCPAT